MREILIMTSTFVVEETPFIALRDPSIRLYNYLCSAVSWVKQGPFEEIVLADNNGCGGLDLAPLVKFARTHCKALEIVSFQGNREAQSFGKGYGEGLTIDRVLETSVLARRAEAFWKTTGRLFVENARVIRDAHRDDPNVIDPLKDIGGALDTRYFKTGVAFHMAHLAGKYREVNDHVGRWIEFVYHTALAGMIPSEVKTFSVKPVYVGWSGTNNVLYDRDYGPDVTEDAKALYRSIVV